MTLSPLQIYCYPCHWIQCLPTHCVHNYLTLKSCLTDNGGPILPGAHLVGKYSSCIFFFGPIYIRCQSCKLNTSNSNNTV